MRVRATHRTHLVEVDADATSRELPGGLATCEPAADDRDAFARGAHEEDARRGARRRATFATLTLTLTWTSSFLTPTSRPSPVATHLRRGATLGKRRVVTAVAGVDLLLPAAPLFQQRRTVPRAWCVFSTTKRAPQSGQGRFDWLVPGDERHSG